MDLILFFKSVFNYKLVSLSYIKVYFESLGESFETSSFRFVIFERVLGLAIRYAHGTHCPKTWVSLCKANLVHPP